MRGSIGGNQGAVAVGNMGGADFVLHPLIYTFGLSESSTKCGSGFFRGKVWIKVCNSHSRGLVWT